MKRIPLYILIGCTIAFGSCHHDTGPADLPSIQPNNRLDTLVLFTANFQGSQWKTDSAYAIIVNYANDSTVENIQITASQTIKDTGTSFVLNLTNFTGPGIYSVTPPVNAVTYYKGNQRYYAVSGVINILSDTSYSLIGNFGITTADSAFVATGTFNVAMP